MADNLTLNSGSGGATLSTDEVTRATVVQHVQYVKLMNGTDAAIDVIPGEATNGLDVDVTRVQGTVAVTQSGTWTIQPGNTANTTAWLVTGTGGTFPVTDSGGSLTVDNAGTFAVQAAQSGTWNVTVNAAIAAGDNNIGNVDIVTMPNVTLAAGTNTNEIVGDAAHDAAIAGNPVRIGGRALANDYTAVAAGDTADLITTLTGKQVVQPYALPGETWSYAAASGGITDTTGVTAKAAGAAGVRHYITSAQVINGHATVSTDVQIRDGASGTVLHRGFAQAAGGGYAVKFDPPLRGTAATLIEVACGTTGSATYVNLQGYSAAE